ncbi:hypothetical protein KUV80_10005 [Fictibacillus nanhaiensis]|uniref:hypothetical protein n=1 Tax=Fictibacillus nanhaiensis TaxID=742169 RepID=UPI001C95E8FA|nr:hypothetical protein [Fictibacillus nanhaiensis]MBY6036990.1 hypothetical protein [Fictibacillus nanhaiensis]
MLVVFISTLIFPTKSLATSWAYSFVVWEDNIYVISDEYVSEINSEIGQVSKYSDMKSYPGNFSNTYEKGTKYYSIKGINPNEVIAIEESNGRYIKAYRDGEYEIRSVFDGYFDGQQGVIRILVLLSIGILAVMLIYKFKKNRKNGKNLFR